jgi:hypothetical protein
MAVYPFYVNAGSIVCTACVAGSYYGSTGVILDVHNITVDYHVDYHFRSLLWTWAAVISVYRYIVFKDRL